MTSTTLEQILTGDWTLDPVHSTCGFLVTHDGVAKFRGQFEQVEATLKDGVLVGRARVESVTTAVPELKESLLSPDFFDAARTPTVAFRSTDIRVADDGAAEVDGVLTIRGVSRQMTARGTAAQGTNVMGADVVGFDLDATIDRRDYGLGWQLQLPNGADAVGWDVTLEVHLELTRA